MSDLLTLCQDAMEGVLDQNIPTTIANNTSPQASLLKRCAQDTGRSLERSFSWQALKRTHSFSTVEDDTDYALPSDLRRIANLTIWSSTDQWPLIHVSDAGWRELKTGITVSGIRFYYSVFNNSINLDPAPGSTSYTIIFDYYSKYFIEDSGGTGKDRWTSDTDVSRLDENLMTLGIRYRYLARNGLPYDEEKAEYMDAYMQLKADDRPMPLIDMAPTPGLWPVNVPDGNWSIT